MKNTVLTILWAFFLVGCSTPYQKEIWSTPGTTPLNNNEEKQKVSYIARYLLPKEEALKLDENIRGSEWINDSLLISTTSVAGSLIKTGNPLSISGVHTSANLGTALTVASWLMPEEGLMEKVSGIYLPKLWEGKPIETAEMAKEIAITHTEYQLRKTAQLHDLDFACIANCESMMSRVYHLVPTDNTNFSQYIYQAPGGVYVTTHWLDLIQPEQANPIESAALGFDIGWMSPPGNTWVVTFWGTPTPDENGKIAIHKGERGFVYPTVQHDLNWTNLGLSLYKSFSDDGGYLFIGRDDQNPNFVTYNGKLYSYISRRSNRFIEYEVAQNNETKTP